MPRPSDPLGGRAGRSDAGDDAAFVQKQVDIATEPSRSVLCNHLEATARRQKNGVSRTRTSTVVTHISGSDRCGSTLPFPYVNVELSQSAAASQRSAVAASAVQQAVPRYAKHPSCSPLFVPHIRILFPFAGKKHGSCMSAILTAELISFCICTD